MKIIYSGGWNKHDEESVRKCFVYTYSDKIMSLIKNGKRIAFITLAKPDGYHDDKLSEAYDDRLEVIDTTSSPNWSVYDGLFIPGGDSTLLKERLLEKEFSLEVLKDSCVILGDSAGAVVLSSYYYDNPSDNNDKSSIDFLEGLNPASKLITIVHANNPVYCDENLVKRVEEFAKEHNLRVLKLDENEQKMLQNGEFINVNPDML